VAVLLPKSMTFTATSGDAFKSVPEDPNVQTYVLKNATPGKAIEFTVSGTGSMPREQQGTPGAQQPAGMGGQDAGATTSDAQPAPAQPGGGIGNPIGTPDPLTKYKWWILGGWDSARRSGRVPAAQAGRARRPCACARARHRRWLRPIPRFASPAAKNSQLLNVLKEELFRPGEREDHGAIDAEEYARVKAALETVLKRALSRK
jgi:hypothetical protein